MAYVKLSNNKGIKVSSAQAYQMFEVLEGRREPENDKQAQFMETIKAIYLPWREADDEYIASNSSILLPMILGSWMVNGDGIPTRPDDKQSWDSAHKLRLWEHGGPSVLAKQYIDRWPSSRSYASGTLGNKVTGEQ